MGDNVMLEELGEQGIYAYNRISDYLSYAKNNEKGKVLLSKLIEHKCK